MNTWSIFIRWGHCNPTRRNGGHRLHMGFSWCFLFKQSIAVLKSAVGPAGLPVLSVEIRSPTEWCRRRLYTSRLDFLVRPSSFPGTRLPCGLRSTVKEPQKEILVLLEPTEFCYKFQEGQDFFASLFCSILHSQVPTCGLVFREMLPVTVLFLVPISWGFKYLFHFSRPDKTPTRLVFS